MILRRNLPQNNPVIAALGWTPVALSVLNYSDVEAYVRVGATDIPDASNYDYKVGAGQYLTVPLRVPNFAIALNAAVSTGFCAIIARDADETAVGVGAL